MIYRERIDELERRVSELESLVKDIKPLVEEGMRGIVRIEELNAELVSRLDKEVRG